MLERFGPYGGSELRAWRLARCLAASGICCVSMLVFDYGQSRQLMRDGVIFSRDVSHVWARGFWARLRGRAFRAWYGGRVASLDFPGWECRAWESAAADVYVAFGVTAYSAKLARWCAATGRRFILMLGSDMDLDPAEPGAHALFDQPGMLVAQTEHQRQEVRRLFGRDTELLRNPVVISAEEGVHGPREFALWVGKSDRIKCPERMLELAHLCPGIPVTMIMNRADAKLFDALKAEAPPNVNILDAVEPDFMRHYYSRAFALVSTSRIEGFANSFLEAGACGTPVLSMDVDPDGYIAVYGGGILASKLTTAADELTRLYGARHWATGSHARTMGESAFRYVAANHESSLIMTQFAGLIDSELEMVA
jgi:glycosyltransferase involved in cell wall biosynthesis